MTTTSRLRPVAVIQSEKSIPSLKPLFTSRHRSESRLNRDSWVHNSSRRVSCAIWSNGRWRSTTSRSKSLQGGAADAVARDPKPVPVGWHSLPSRRAKRGLHGGDAIFKDSGPRYIAPSSSQHFYMDRVLNNSVYPDSNVLSYARRSQPDYPCGARTTCAIGESSGCALAVDVVPDIAEGAIAGASGQRLPGSSRATRMTRRPDTSARGSYVGGGSRADATTSQTRP